LWSVGIVGWKEDKEVVEDESVNERTCEQNGGEEEIELKKKYSTDPHRHGQHGLGTEHGQHTTAPF
jgi:hypothetical protein